MKMKKMISNNKACTCIMLGLIGAAMGLAAAKAVIACCNGNTLRCKAKKALQTIEEKI